VNSTDFGCIASSGDSFRFEVSLDHDCYRVYALSCGIDKEELFPVFQPQLSLENNKICGWEALVRWRDHKGELFQPSEFMPIIEKYHMLEVVTKVMLNQVLQCLSTCSARFLHQHIAINVSGKMLANGCFRDMLTSSFAQHRTLFSKLFIEITETDVISDFEAAKQELAELRGLGIHCALDDFGTGYSGFETICELPIDVLKIDGRYVRDLESRPSMEVILKSMIDSAHSLGMTVVAEWVEKDKQKEVLKSLGCDAIQGHLVSEALDCQALSHLVVDGV
jgi:EAL domain-containing protein (putative c-di-GMP-specific phosphodiesterase class I)